MATYQTEAEAEAAMNAAVAAFDPKPATSREGLPARRIMCPLPSHSEDDGSNQGGGCTVEVRERQGRFSVTANCFAGCDWKTLMLALGLWQERVESRQFTDYEWEWETENDEEFKTYRREFGPGDKKHWTTHGWKHRLNLVKPRTFGHVEDDDVLVIVEGERKAERTSLLDGFAGLTYPCGQPGAVSREGWYEEVDGKDCVIWADNDRPGIKRGHTAASIIDGHAKSIRWVDGSGLPAKGDIRDVDDDTAIRMLNDAKPYTPPDATHGGQRENAGRRAGGRGCYREHADALVNDDVVKALDALGGRFRILQNLLHRLDDDHFWRQYSDGSRSALAQVIVELTDACVTCANAVSGPVWHMLMRDWIDAGRPQPNRYRAFNIQGDGWECGKGYRAFTIQHDGKVALVEVTPDMLLTVKPRRVIGDYTQEPPMTLWTEKREVDGETYTPLCWGFKEPTINQLVRMIAKSLDREAMFGDDDVINLVGDTGTGKGSLIEQVKAMLDDHGMAFVVMKARGMHWEEDKVFTRNNIVILNEANNPHPEYIERTLAATDSTIEVNEKNKPMTPEVARFRGIFVSTRHLRFEAATGMGRRIMPFISKAPGHQDGGTIESVKISATSDEEVTKLFCMLVRSEAKHHRVGEPVSQVRAWKEEVLDSADPVRAWVNEHVEVGEFAPTPLRQFAKALCEHLDWKSVDKAMPRVKSALRAVRCVDVRGEPRRPQMVHGARLREGGQSEFGNQSTSQP